MPIVTFNGKPLCLSETETLLDALIRLELPISYSCKMGLCHSCLLQETSGQAPEAAQAGLKDSLKNDGIFLACLCKPEKDMTVISLGAETYEKCSFSSCVTGKELLGSDVLEVSLSTPDNFLYKAGQYITLRRENDGLSRSYSLASAPDLDKGLKLHIRLVPGGKMSLWLKNEVQVGHTLRFHGPHGDCYLSETNFLKNNDLFLLGVGTGISPLYGIAKDAIYKGFNGKIFFVQVGLNESRVYFVDQLQQLRNQSADFFYHRIFSSGLALSPFEQVGNLEDCLDNIKPNYKNSVFFLCGDPDVVARLKKFLFLSGVSLKNIRSDAFVMLKAD